MERTKTVVKKGVVYGSMSFYQGKKADEHNSHKWACYVRGSDDEDISTYVKKVVFQLHPSFSNPTRSIEKPPFEIHETGWGEFEIVIQLHFYDPREKRLDIPHLLQLYPKQPGSSQSTKKPVVSEHYDEIIFTDPYPEFYQRLTAGEGTPPDTQLLESSFHQELKLHYSNHSDSTMLKMLEDAYSFIKQEANEMRDKLRKADLEIQNSRSELREEEKKAREG